MRKKLNGIFNGGSNEQDDESDEEDEQQADSDRPGLPIEQDAGQGGPAPGTEHDEDMIGWFIGPNDLAEALSDYEGDVEERFGYEIRVMQVENQDMGGNLFGVEDTAAMWETKLEKGMLWLASNTDYVFMPLSLGGTGFLAVKLTGVDNALPTTADIVIPDHNIKTASDPETVAQNVIMQTVALPLIDPGSILIDHRIDVVNYHNVAPEIAQMMGAIGHSDIQDLQIGYWSLFYETIPIAGKNGSDVIREIKRESRTTDPYFTPAEWAPWLDQRDAPVAGEPTIVALIPEEMDVVAGQRMMIETHSAPVSNVHVLGFVPLSRDWIERQLMKEGVEWLDEQFQARDNRYYTTLRDLAHSYGVQRPLEEWEGFKRDHLDAAIQLDSNVEGASR